MLFLALVALVAVLAGATAAVAGFGIGSLLTPLLATALGMPTAIAAVALPHAAATLLRAWRLRGAIDWPLLRGFGLLSALGGLAGALLFARLGGAPLTRLLGALLLLTAAAVLTRAAERARVGRAGAAVLGLLSGAFGGAVGNQGGLRAAALLAFPLTPAAFVATSTAVGVLVDAARTPIYLWRSGDRLLDLWPIVLVATAGTVLGTLLGERVLLGLSRERFRRLVAVLVGVLGLWLLVAA